MIELVEWGRQVVDDPRPWLILGKGPSFDLRGRFDLDSYRLFSLNHVVSKVPVEVAHIIDLDVVEACAAELEANCQWLVMPRYPHRDCRPTRHPLDHYVESIPVLQRLDRTGRLVWYNLDWGPAVPGSPVLSVQTFSSEAALGILGHIGARTIRSLGVDGGRRYGGAFDTSTLLANRRATFDTQFARLDQLSHEFNLDYRPLIDPLRIFIGGDASQDVAASVLEHSIRSSTSWPVAIERLPLDVGRSPKDPGNRQRTAFSFSRFLIPELCGYQGAALYLDADMQVFGDVGEVFELSFGSNAVLCTSQPAPSAWEKNAWFRPGRQFSVMLLDCGRLNWRIDDIIEGLDSSRYTYDELMFDLCVVDPEQISDAIPPEWNHLERCEPGKTKLTHYTVVPTQPWKRDGNPLEEVWLRGFRSALKDGAVTSGQISQGVRAGHLKPALAREAAVPFGERLLSVPSWFSRKRVRTVVERVAARTGILRATRPLRRRLPKALRHGTHRP